MRSCKQVRLSNASIRWSNSAPFYLTWSHSKRCVHNWWHMEQQPNHPPVKTKSINTRGDLSLWWMNRRQIFWGHSKLKRLTWTKICNNGSNKPGLQIFLCKATRCLLSDHLKWTRHCQKKSPKSLLRSISKRMHLVYLARVNLLFSRQIA